MYLPIKTQPSCASAWLAAVTAVDSASGSHDAQNVIVDVANPTVMSDADLEVISLVDEYLREYDRYPVETVANTIFPRSLFLRHKAPAFYDVYRTKVLPRIKKGDWGRYFDRMITFPLQKKGKYLNPLDEMVTKMRDQVASGRCFRNVYEITIYDPIRDAGPLMNRQCLSFLSFKLTDGPERKLLLTAMYRNHYYIERLLGNLIGLGRLMKFVADEVKVDVGSLTIVSTHAVVDCPSDRESLSDLLDEARATGSLREAA
ncbi:thymidylate synthase [Mesorhizobium robiniae]|uniref:Thymidylate synthase n=1 Tax=Mesorhizobium robiniae TaxID=559315 RepID=A0ABV2GWK5_9HYPH|nr:hypothetical protein [Mesorhizobium sp. ZC-5]MCV3242089.1 hypothetical protein [Mesorhizobium sp. ZC-5]